MEAEISRILKSQAAILFAEGDPNRILDTDFYAYLGVTVRTKANDFLGRFNTVHEAILAAAKIEPSAQNCKLLELHNYLNDRFNSLIPQRTENR
jgi:hypothetical protein